MSELKNKAILHRAKPEEMNRMPGHEVVSSRRLSSKTFLLGENLYQSVLFADQVHFLDKRTKNYEEIDNTLIEKEDQEYGYYLTSKRNGALDVRMYPSDAKQLLTITDENSNTIGWRVLEANPVKPEIERLDPPKHEADDLRRDALDTLYGTAAYPEILPGVTLRCTVGGASFKDEYVFAGLEAIRPISILLSTAGLRVRQEKNGAILLVDQEGEAVFSLPFPFLRDAHDDLGEVRVELEQSSGSEWLVTYIPDAVWADKAAYPVVLDPAVRTKNIATAIEDNCVASKKPDYIYPYGNTNLPVFVNNSTYGTAYSYLKFQQSDLPVISSSYYVTKAYLYTSLKTSPSTNTTVYVREVLSDWSSQTITYNQQPDVADKYTEYGYYSAGCGVNGSTQYDISNLVRKWYTGNNYGIRFEVTSGGLNLHSSDAAYHRPYIIINYVSLAGEQSGLSYETQSAGRAGEGQVSLYNGNLVFTHQDTSMNGNLMPVSVSHVYNSCYYKKDAFGTGLGWTISAQQYLHKEVVQSGSTSTTTYYVYTDDAGARHYFKYSSSKWKDLSGLSLTLTLDTSANTATITDKSDTRMIFDLPTVNFEDDDENTDLTAYANVKPLKQIIDACGNTATFTTDANRRLTKITDGAGRETLFTQADDRIISIKEPGAPKVDYAYDNGRLTQIIYYDQLDEQGEPIPQSTAYTYNEYGLLASVTNIDGLTLTYSYTDTVPRRVTRVELSNNGQKFGGRKYEYKDCLTVVTDLVVDESNTLIDGKKLFYHFNDNGNVVSVNDELGYGCFARYTENMPTNHPEVLSRLQRSVVNLLKNHSFETNAAWTNEILDGATGTQAYSTAYLLMGNRSLYMTRTNDTGALTTYQTVTLDKGRTYTFSVYYFTEGETEVLLQASYLDANGNQIDTDSLTGAHPHPDQKGFDRQSVTFTLPENSAGDTVTVRIMAVGGIGTACFDCAQLEEGAIANPYNMLENGDFTFNVNGKPESWLENSANTASDQVYDTYSGSKPEGLSENTMRIYGRGYSKNPGIYQDIPMTGLKGDVYSAGGWSFNYSKPRKGEDKRYNIRVAFLKSGTTSTRQNSPSIEWSEEWTDWQFASGPVVAPCDYTSIRFNVDYEKNINYAEFGGLFLYKEEFGQTYAYDENQNITSVKDLSSKQSHATYDDYNNLLTYRQPGRSASQKYTLDWGSTAADKKKHLLKKTTSPLNIVQENTYDAKGNPLTATTRNSDSSILMQGSTQYTDDGNYVAGQTDARGYTVTSDYSATTGTLTSVTDPLNQTVTYQYDERKRTTQTQSTDGTKTYKNRYEYTDDRLTRVAHNTTGDTCDVEYTFAYDGAGRQTEVKVGSQTLSATAYNQDDTVREIVYGNNNTGTLVVPHSVHYSYDGFRRLKGVRYGGDAEDRYTYEYGANGQVGRLRDRMLNREYFNEYDTANRPMRIVQKQNSQHLYTGRVEYDEFNNLQSFRELVGGDKTEYRTSFEYDIENKPTKLKYGSETDRLEYRYDGIGRMAGRSLFVNGQEYETAYTYVPGADNKTSPLIQSITQYGENFSYVYDSVGNITSATRNDVTTQYFCDKLGQLIRVNDPTDTAGGTTGTTWVYEYDCGGNMLYKRRYAYTTDADPGTPQETTEYAYTNSNWKDQLTGYTVRNVAGTITTERIIQYDAIGNPTNDGEWIYTWEHGRQLREMSSGTENVTFEYNQDGLRTKKTSTTTGTTEYILHGKNIVHLIHDDGVQAAPDELHFFYDAQNRVTEIEYNGSRYGIIHNLQGDVVGLLDSNGTEVVKYTYDAWGRQLDITGTMSGSLGMLNPFRYRGYVYDEETGLYYLRSRYYLATSIRFLSSDTIINCRFNSIIITSYCYCENNPIINQDPNGLLCEWALLIGTIVITAANAIKSINCKIKSKINESKTQTKSPVVIELPPKSATQNNTFKPVDLVEGKYRELFDSFVDSYFATYNHTYRYGGGIVPYWVDKSELIASAEVSYWRGRYSSSVENHIKITVRYGYKNSYTAIGIQRHLSFALQSIQYIPDLLGLGAILSDIIGMSLDNIPDYDSNLEIIEHYFEIIP